MNLDLKQRRAIGFLVLAFLAAASLWVLMALPPVVQDEQYHRFADQRTIWSVPNFWNVISNAPFLIAALLAARALFSSTAFTQHWERAAYIVLIVGVAWTAFGSGYYHFTPNTQTLFWDRLPMTIVFMSLFAVTIGERIHMKAGQLLLLPLLLTGASSVLYWQSSGDLRFYGLVQFLPMIAIPVMLLLFPARYSNTSGIWTMLGFYLLAKTLEFYDRPIAEAVATGGHPWKHAAGAVAIVAYGAGVARRRPLP